VARDILDRHLKQQQQVKVRDHLEKLVICIFFVCDITKSSPYFVYCTSTNMTNETINNRLTDFLKEGKNWERKQTNVPGVFLLKLPAFKSRPACIAIEIDAMGQGGGGSNRRRGLIIRTKEDIGHLSRRT
jgi:hypothetical protein